MEDLLGRVLHGIPDLVVDEYVGYIDKLTMDIIMTEGHSGVLEKDMVKLLYRYGILF